MKDKQTELHLASNNISGAIEKIKEARKSTAILQLNGEDTIDLDFYLIKSLWKLECALDSANIMQMGLDDDKRNFTPPIEA